jgi:hypothetical protein
MFFAVVCDKSLFMLAICKLALLPAAGMAMITGNS